MGDTHSLMRNSLIQSNSSVRPVRFSTLRRIAQKALLGGTLLLGACNPSCKGTKETPAFTCPSVSGILFKGESISAGLNGIKVRFEDIRRLQRGLPNDICFATLSVLDPNDRILKPDIIVKEKGSEVVSIGGKTYKISVPTITPGVPGSARSMDQAWIEVSTLSNTACSD